MDGVDANIEFEGCVLTLVDADFIYKSMDFMLLLSLSVALLRLWINGFDAAIKFKKLQQMCMNRWI